MTMGGKTPDDQGWDALGKAWQEQDGALVLAERELAARLRRQRIMMGVLATAEVASLVPGLGAVAYMTQGWLATRGSSPILILWVLLCLAVLLWLRMRHAAAAGGALEGLDDATQRDERLLEIARLGSVMGMIALGAMIVAVVMSVRHDLSALSPVSLAGFATLSAYVFGLQIVLMTWGMRVRARRRQREAIQQTLRSP
jgi:hypothetical protein